MSGPFDAFLSRCVSDCVNATPAPSCDPGCEECEAVEIEVEEEEAPGPEQELRERGLSERDFL